MHQTVVKHLALIEDFTTYYGYSNKEAPIHLRANFCIKQAHYSCITLAV